ncbi:MAG: hypothetical protein AAF514_20440 [Verrucomicrobiota bacterium]
MKLFPNLLFLLSVAGLVTTWAQDQPEVLTESDFYTITPLRPPADVYPEVSGLAIDPEKNVYVGTRRGDVYQLRHAFPGDRDEPEWKLWVRGIHEPIGMSWEDGALLATQRPELTRIRDRDGDGRADSFQTICDHWGINGDYHEYAFGSPPDRDGNVWIVLCLTGSGSYKSDFRGWCVRVTPDGRMIPTASGIRSPGGIGFNAEGDVFYTDNQGPWNGSSSVKHLAPGSFQGNPSGWPAFDDLQSGLLGGKPPQPKSGSRIDAAREKIPNFVPPAVVLPHGKMGQSPTGIIPFPGDGTFGPFEGQVMVGEQTFSQIQRLYLEKVNGVYQGAAFPFLSGFESGNIALAISDDGVLFTGGSNRGWGARGGKPYNMDRVTWNGKVPFEVREMRAKPDGFQLTFTQPVDRAKAGAPGAYRMKAFTYLIMSRV